MNHRSTVFYRLVGIALNCAAMLYGGSAIARMETPSLNVPINIPNPNAGEPRDGFPLNPFPNSILLPDLPNELPSAYRSLDVGSSSVCAIRKNGRLDCWGFNAQGQSKPPKGTYRAVSVGERHACAIKMNGGLVCWGDPSAFPDAGALKGKYSQVSSGDRHTCAIRKGSGIVQCWGSNDFGELNVPPARFKKIDAEANHTCGITQSAGLICWGEESFGNYPLRPGQYLDVATGALHGCAIRKDDLGVSCWGNFVAGQTSAPKGAFEELLAGDFHSCGRRSDHSVVCWGSNSSGQLDIPSRRTKSIGGGGGLTCGLDENDRIWCSGSFAYNPFLYEASDVSGYRDIGIAGESTPKFLPFAFLGQIAAVVGGGLVNYGKGADKNWNGAEAKGVKWQLGLSAGSIIFGALSTFLPQPPSKTELLLQDIQSKLEQLQQSINDVSADVKEINSLVAESYCNQQLAVLQTNTDIVLNSARDYRILLGKVNNLITASANKQPLISPLPDIQRFIDRQGKAIADARSNIGRAMLGYVSTSPLDACLVSSVVNRKQSGKLALDDRDFFANSYRILNIALSAQAMAQMMEQDINVYLASRALMDPLPGASPPPILLPPEDLAGICSTIRSPVSDVTNPRWSEAAIYCDLNTENVKTQYAEYIEQIEKIGAPYTDDFQMLSINSELSGLGKIASNLLWPRNMNDVRLLRNHGDGISNLTQLSTQGDLNLYLENGSSGEGVWKAAGNEWNDLLAAFSNAAEQNKTSKKIDFLESLENQKDFYTEKTLFQGIRLKPFWMSGVTFSANLNNIKLKTHRSLADGPTMNMKCFVASGINKLLNDNNEISGKMCSMEEFNAMNSSIGKEEMPLWRVNLYGRDCGDWSGAAELTDYCVGNGSAFLGVSDPGGSSGSVYINRQYSPYVSMLGDYIIRYDQKYWYSDLYYAGSDRQAAFFPGSDANLYVMPVLDVSKRTCLDSLLVANKSKRLNYRDANVAKVPSRCGKDLDRAIRDLIPRPDETIPAYGDLVKIVKPLRVN